MKEVFKKLTRDTGLTLYLCQKSSSLMVTIHGGGDFDGEFPEWLHAFVDGDNPILPFEQDGRRMLYFKWHLDDNYTVVFLDDTKFTGLYKVLNYFLCASSAGGTDVEAGILLEKLQHIKQSLDTERRQRESDLKSLKELQDAVISLREQNADQAVRLKDALSQNLELARQAKPVSHPAVEDPAAQKARATVAQLRDENSRLAAQIKGWEEKYLRLKDQYENTAHARQVSPVKNNDNLSSAYSSVGLYNVISALNRVIDTGNAAEIDLETLSMITQVPSREELEKNPESVKNLIARLIGMEKSGQLTTFQIRRLNSMFA